MGLICESFSKVNFLYVGYFVCYGIGGLLSFPIMDKISRRTSHMIFSTIHLIAQAVIIFVPTYTARLLGFSVMGLMCAKNSLSYTWLFEFVKKEHKSSAASCVSIVEFMTCIIAGLYFMFISRDWAPL